MGPKAEVFDAASAPPKPKRNTEDAMREAAKLLRVLLERELAKRMPAWTVQSTPRGLGVDIREAEHPIALVWWDKDGWWCKRWPSPGVKGVEPIHDMDEWTVGSMTAWILKNDPGKPKKPIIKPSRAGRDPGPEVRAASPKVGSFPHGKALATALRVAIKGRELAWKVAAFDRGLLVRDAGGAEIGDLELDDHTLSVRQWLEDEMTQEERYSEIAEMTLEQLLDAIVELQWPDGMPR